MAWWLVPEWDLCSVYHFSYHYGNFNPVQPPRSILNRKRTTRAETIAVPASFISFGGIWSGLVDLFIFSKWTFFAYWSLIYRDFVYVIKYRDFVYVNKDLFVWFQVEEVVQHSHSDFELLPVRSIQLLKAAVEVRLLASLLLWRNKNSSCLLYTSPSPRDA